MKLNADFIKNGYCVVVQDFRAYCVPFTTVSVGCGYMEVPTYKVELPNGKEMEFNETELTHSKEEVEKMCEKLNKEMEEDRKIWLMHGLPAIRKYESIGM